MNDVFTPDVSEVTRAKRIIAAFEEAEATGSASIQVDGYFVDYPIVEKARRVFNGRMRNQGRTPDNRANRIGLWVLLGATAVALLILVPTLIVVLQ